MSSMITYKFRIKDATTAKRLNQMAGNVNLVWNYCNETSIKAIRYDNKWLSNYDLHKLTSGCGSELNLHSQTMQKICDEYTTRRKQFKKLKLKWRSKKRSLGWIPFKASGINIENDTFTYCKKKYKLWNSRKIDGVIKEGCFNQDARGRWYINFQCEVEEFVCVKSKEIGIDLGLTENITCSDGKIYARESYTKRMAFKLAMAQKAHKKKQITTIHAKIANSRKDWNHKTTTKILSDAHLVVIGDVKSAWLMKTNKAKSTTDTAWFQVKSMFAYKSKMLGIECKLINENWTTQTCSSCLKITGPRGLTGLPVREWICSDCGSIHHRDVNAAKNILRLGHQTPIKGIPRL